MEGMTPDPRVLEWVNYVRDRYLGAPTLDALPAGVPKDACQCPVARALTTKWPVEVGAFELNVYALYDAADALKIDLNLRVPDEVRAFIRDFDDGEYPDLVAAA